MNVFLYLLMTVVFVPEADQPNDCRRFKNGRFRVQDERYGIDVLIERNKDVQTETSFSRNTVSKFKVKWISECEYELEVLEGRDELKRYYAGKTLLVRIVETSAKAYKYEAHIKGESRVVTQVADVVD